MIEILSYQVSTIWPTMVGPGEKIFDMKIFRRLEEAVLRLVLANAVFHKRGILLNLSA